MNEETLKALKLMEQSVEDKSMPSWILPLVLDQPSPDYDTPEENAYSAGLQSLDTQGLSISNMQDAIEAAKNTGLDLDALGRAADTRQTLSNMAEAASKSPGILSLAYQMVPQSRKDNERNTNQIVSAAAKMQNMFSFMEERGTLTEEEKEAMKANFAQVAATEYDNFYGGLSKPPGPVGRVPMSQLEQQQYEAEQQAERAAEAAAAEAAQTARDQEGFGGSSSPDSRGGPSQGGGTSGSGRGGTGSSGSLSGGFDGPDSSDDGVGTEGFGGEMDAAGLNTGGRIGALIQHLQTGGDVENADTNMEVANVPMGVVNDADGAPSPFSGGTGVEDDLDMDVEAGSYVLNAEAVQLIGISDINAVIRDAYSIAAALGKPMPQDYDPQNKVPIRISNGEAVIPKALVDIIGLDKLEKWNQKGLQLRKQKEEFMAQQQQAQPPQGPQVAAEAPMQQQMGQLMNQGGKTEYGQLQVGEISQGINLDAFTNSENTEQLQRLLSGEVESSDEKLIPKNITQPEIEYILRKHYGAKLPKGFREAVNNQRVPRNLGELAKVITNAEWRNSNELEKGHTFRFTGYDKANAKGEFSSAFGPGQVTATRAKDILKLIPDTDQNFKTYVKEYIEQGNKRISLLQNRNAKRKEQRIPLKKPDKTLFAKGIGNIPLEKHEKYYNRLFNLHLEDHLNTYRK